MSHVFQVEKLSAEAARECLQMVVWLIEESHWTPETLDDIAGTLVEYGLLDPEQVEGDIDPEEWDSVEAEQDSVL